MVEKKSGKEPDPKIRKLYPHLTDEELLEAEENLKGYLEAVLRIYERIRKDPEEYARFKQEIAALRQQRAKQKSVFPASVIEMPGVLSVSGSPDVKKQMGSHVAVSYSWMSNATYEAALWFIPAIDREMYSRFLSVTNSKV